MSPRTLTPTRAIAACLLFQTLATPSNALIEPPLTSDSISRNSYVDPSLGTTATIEFVPASDIVPPAFLLDGDDTAILEAGEAAVASLAGLSALTSPWTDTKIDLRSGRPAKIDLNLPLFPGPANGLLRRVLVDGIVENDDDVDDEDRVETESSPIIDWAISGIRTHLTRSDVASSLMVDASELFGTDTVRYAMHGHNRSGKQLIQLHLGRMHRSIPVRGSRAFATVKNGNWIHFGLEKWGDVVDEWGKELNVVPSLTAEEARVRLSQWAEEDLALETENVNDDNNNDSNDTRTRTNWGQNRHLSNLFHHDQGADRNRPDLEMDVLDLCEPQLQILTLDNNHDDESNSSENNSSSNNNKERNRNSRRLKNKNKNKSKNKTTSSIRKHKRKNKNDSDDDIDILETTSQEPPTFPIGNGYKHALVWRICPKFKHQNQEIMEGLVDAHTGRVYSFVDTVDYFLGVGSVYPVSNDGKVPDGVLQQRWPMPYLHVQGVAGGIGEGEVVVSETGGHYWSLGNQTVSLRGKYVAMADRCGKAEMTVQGNFDWGGTNGTDCTTPGFGGAGNTQASRSGYYELNRIIEIARSHLPRNGWLKRQLTANMNIPKSCNAFWDGLTVNFYRSSASCANTGEIAGVFDHEWGHGLDDNDVSPTIVEPSGEGIADIYTALRMGDSCIGRGFFYTPCTGYGDKCINNCTGVRDIDYEQHQSRKPHTLTWTNKNCGQTNVHCRGLVYSEAVWSLWKRDLPSFYGYDDNTSLEIVMRLTFIAAGNVATWYSGSPPYGGCGGGSGYLSYLLADDDDGDITNGTPHMQAIFAAHNRQEIACDTPTVQDSGCSGTPRVAPEVTVISGSMQNIITWTSVSNATNYQVFRTEGVYKCAQGKVLLATLPSDTLNFTDTGLMNGREYFYIVIPKGHDDACFGLASECIQASPSQGPGYQLTCRPELVVLNKAEERINATHLCTLFAMSDYTGAISLTCAGMTGVECTPPSSITFLPGDEYIHAQISINATASASIGGGQLYVSATDGTTQRKAHISVLVVTPGGTQTAAYDPSIGVPACFASGTECSSGDLLDGRGDSEVNSPNILDDCYDGRWGTYHIHPSNDKIVIRSGKRDGTGSELAITERSYATISATVWSFVAASCFADFYYTTDVSADPTWKYIGTVATTKARASEVLEVDYKLPKGLKQAVRVNFRYLGSPSTCHGGGFRNYGDPDDLVFIAKESDFYIECPDWLVVVEKSDAPTTISRNCTLTTSSTFDDTVSFSCNSTALAGVDCIAPPDINVESGTQVNVSYVIKATDSIATGETKELFIFAKSGAVSSMSTIPMLVVSSGGAQAAAYDGQLGAPRCFAKGTECSSGELLDGRGEVGPEPNFPNTLDTCTDGNNGTYHVDEQLDKIVVRSGKLDGTGSDALLAEGEYATIVATVFAYNNKDRADFWYTSDAFNPAWVYIGSVQPQRKNTTEVLKVEYILPQGAIQAVRVKYDYLGNVTTCPETTYGDADDLVFAVNYTPFFVSCPSVRVVFNKEETPISTELSCTLFAMPDFEDAVNMSCDSSALSGLTCTTTSPINIEPGALKTNINLLIDVLSSAIVGENGDIVVSATTENTTKTSRIPIVIVEGGGFQAAEYDSQLGAPRCFLTGNECSSERLLDGRGTVGPEPNFPNTLDNCKDGNSGAYHTHPSIDKITVKSKNTNVDLSEYEAVTISAKVWSTFAEDLFADFYYTAFPADPNWIFIGTMTTALQAQQEVLEIDYNLPQGTLQAVRVHFRYKGQRSPCPNGNYQNYGDADDLVFAVKSSPFTFECPETVQFNTKNIPEIIDVECMLSVHSNVSGTIDLSCSSSSLKGVNCTTPPTYDISPGDSTANVGVRLDADASLRVGESGEIFVSASYGAVSKAAVIKVLIVGPGGDQLAIYNSSYGAPFCDLSASSCSSGTLLVGRGSVGPEPNAPNSIDGCEDGNKGVHHKDESVDKIIVRSGRLEGPSVGTIREEEYVTIIATVWAYSANDTAEFWITSNPINPSWDYIGSLNVTVEDTTEEIKMEVRLSKGPTQAVRVVFHYLSNANLTACPGGSWDDVDDLVFVVDPADITLSSPTSLPTTSFTTSPMSGSTNAPSESPSTSPTVRPIVSITNAPSTNIPTSPTAGPMAENTNAPSRRSSSSPTLSPVADSTSAPSTNPSTSLTAGPMAVSTSSPSKNPTTSPTASPIMSITNAPSTNIPTSPTAGPMADSTNAPSKSPSSPPTSSPVKGSTNAPSTIPSTSLTTSPTTGSTSASSDSPSGSPTAGPVAGRTIAPSKIPSTSPTASPMTGSTNTPSKGPSTSPIASPVVGSTNAPSTNISTSPTAGPMAESTNSPSKSPSSSLTLSPAAGSTNAPSINIPTSPTAGPMAESTNAPSKSPSSSPTSSPVASSTNAPSTNIPTSPTAGPMAESTNAPSKSPSSSPTASPVVGSTNAPSTNIPTSPTAGPMAESTNAPSKSPSSFPTSSPFVGSTNAPSTVPSTSLTTSPTTGSTSDSSDSPSSSPTAGPVAGRTITPSTIPSTSPTASPMAGSTNTPSKGPSTSPIASPVVGSTNAPSTNISTSPTAGPMAESTKAPSKSPSSSPTSSPVVGSTNAPSTIPSTSPTVGPMAVSTSAPSSSPPTSLTASPVVGSTNTPSTNIPTSLTAGPMVESTKTPSKSPSSPPTLSPVAGSTNAPSTIPSTSPTAGPTAVSTGAPSKSPSTSPTASPLVGSTNAPSTNKSASPTAGPMAGITNTPSKGPSTSPTASPVVGSTNAPIPTSPTAGPMAESTNAPSKSPSSSPTLSPVVGNKNAPSKIPSTSPTASPSTSPTASPVVGSTNAPTFSGAPSRSPSSSPSHFRTESPSYNPTKQPTYNPTESGSKSAPSKGPSSAPTSSPFYLPSGVPSSSPIAGSTNAPSTSPIIAPTTLAPSSVSLSPVALGSPTILPKEMPSVIINVKSSLDWRIACADVSDDAIFLEIARVLELSVEETIEPYLFSNQVLRYVSASEFCGVTIPNINSKSRRRFEDPTIVNFTMEVEERCVHCDQNATVALNLFDHVHRILNSAVNDGELKITLQTNGNAANLTLLSNLTISLNSTVSTYVMVTNSSTMSPTSVPTTSITPPSHAPSTKPSTSGASWFMKFSSMKCYQDCTGNYPCGGPKEFWNDAYPTLNDCCLINLGNSDPDLTANCLAGGAQ